MQDHASTRELLKRVLETANELIGSDYCFFGLVEEKKGEPFVIVRDNLRAFEIGWKTYLGQFKVGGRRLPADERSFTGYVASTKRPRRRGNVAIEIFYHAGRKDIQSELAVPVVLNGEVLAVINLESQIPKYYTKEHQDLLCSIARLIAPPLDRLMTREGLRPSLARTVLNAITIASEAPLPLDAPFDRKSLDELMQALAVALRSKSCTLWLARRDSDALVLQGAAGPRCEWAAPYREQVLTQRMVRHCGHKSNGRMTAWLMIAPLFSAGRPIGVVQVGMKHRTLDNPMGAYLPVDEEQLQTVLGPLASGIELRRLLWERREQAAKQAALVSSLTTSFVGLNLEDTLKTVVRKVPELCHGQRCSVFLWEERRKEFVLRASNRLPRKLVYKAGYSRGEGATGFVGDKGKLLNLTWRTLAERRLIFAGLRGKGKYREGRGPLLLAPIFSEQQVIGVIRVGRRAGSGRFQEYDELMLTTVASHISAAIANNRDDRVKLLNQLHNVMTVVKDHLVQRASRDHDIGQSVASAAFDSVRRELGVDVINLHAYDADRKTFETPPIVIGRLLHRQMMKGQLSENAFPWRVLRDGTRYWERVRGEKCLEEPLPLAFRKKVVPRFAVREKIASVAALRLDVGNSVVGVLMLNFRKPQRFDGERRKMIEKLTSHIALCMEMARLYRKIGEDASREEAEYLAQETHDAVLATLTSVALARSSEATCRLRNGDVIGATQDLGAMENAVRYSVAELREIIKLIKEHPVDDYGLIGALKRYTKDVWEPMGLTIHLPKQEPPLQPSLKRHLYRIAVASIGNVVAHANAHSVHVDLRRCAQAVTMTIEDNGIGFDVATASRAPGHYGIKLLFLRAVSLGGKAHIESALGRGTTVSVEIPLIGLNHATAKA